MTKNKKTEYMNGAKWASVLAGFSAMLAGQGGYLSRFGLGLTAIGFAAVGLIVLGVDYI
jgi:hypothetical protein